MDTSDRSPVARRFSSTLPSARLLGPTTTCQGMPRGRRWRTSRPAARRGRRRARRGRGPTARGRASAGVVGGAVAGLEVEQATLNGATASGQMIPASSCEASMSAADEPRKADAVGAHVHRHAPGRPGPSTGAHGLRIFGAEIEDMADLDAARRDLSVLRDGARRRPASCISLGGGIGRGVGVEDRLQAGGVLEIGVGGRDRQVEYRLVAEHLALAGRGQDEELVAEVAADGAGVGAHRDRGEPEPRGRCADRPRTCGCRSGARRPGRGRRNRRPSSGTRASASRRSAGAPRPGTSTGCGRGSAAGPCRSAHRRGRSRSPSPRWWARRACRARAGP